jgi:hypothetical protein
MRTIIRFRPSPAIVISAVALLVALGGSSVAAVTKLAPANSVGTVQVIDNSLLLKDFKAGQVAGGALGYAHVNRDATLDTAFSKNVTLLSAKRVSSEEHYCLRASGAVRAHNVVATLDYSSSSGKRITAFTNPTFVSQECQGKADAVVVISMDGGSSPANAFYVVLN